MNERNRNLSYRWPGLKLMCNYQEGDVYEDQFWVIVQELAPYFTITKEPPFTHYDIPLSYP